VRPSRASFVSQDFDGGTRSASRSSIRCAGFRPRRNSAAFVRPLLDVIAVRFAARPRRRISDRRPSVRSFASPEARTLPVAFSGEHRVWKDHYFPFPPAEAKSVLRGASPLPAHGPARHRVHAERARGGGANHSISCLSGKVDPRVGRREMASSPYNSGACHHLGFTRRTTGPSPSTEKNLLTLYFPTPSPPFLPRPTYNTAITVVCLRPTHDNIPP